MSSVNFKSDKSRHGVPHELYASYIIPVLLLLVVGVSVVLFEWFYAASGYSFSEGKPAPRTYRALSSIKYTDIATTEKLRKMAEDSVTGVVVRDIGASGRMKNRLAKLRDTKNGTSEDLASFFPQELLRAFKELTEDRRQALLLFANRIGSLYFEQIVSVDITASHDKTVLWSEIDKLRLPPGEGNILYQLLGEVIEPSYKIDPELTKFVRDGAKASIPAIEREMEMGDVIVERGQVITPQIARLLKIQGYTEDEFPVTQLVIVCLLMLILPLWLEIPARETMDSRPSWSSIVFVISVGWVFQTTAIHLNIAGAGILASVTVAYLCMPRRFAFNVCLVGVASGVFIITGLSVYNMLLLLISGFLASMAGFYVLRHIDSREHLGYKVFALAFFLVGTKMTILWLQGFPVTWVTLSLRWPLGEVWRICGRFLFFDLATTFLMVSLLPMIEGYIGVLSALRTRELSHPSSSLLRKLQAEAPGTYHHCLMIGTLAEAVANELGLDENLMKAGAYYHDIGKLRRPRFFVENQMGGENIHDTMSPTLSAVAILAHVREGVELANEYGLPKRVKQFITEHHGTTCIYYFYKKALAMGEKVEQEQFCYPGPKPQSRETALLMLLDSLEAAMRAESKNIVTVTDIQEIIDRVIAIKIAEKQLDEVDFTLREITRTKAALLKVFQSMYHTRKVKEIKPKETRIEETKRRVD